MGERYRSEKNLLVKNLHVYVCIFLQIQFSLLYNVSLQDIFSFLNLFWYEMLSENRAELLDRSSQFREKRNIMATNTTSSVKYATVFFKE